LYRGINDFKKGYQPRTSIIKDEKGDLVADSQSNMARWRNYFSQLLNVHEVKDVRQAEIHTVELLVPEPSAFEVELAIEKLKNHKSPSNDQIPAELIKAVGRTIRCDIHKLINSVWNKEELPDEWKESIIIPIYKKGDKADSNNYRGTIANYVQNFVQHPALKDNPICVGSYWGSSMIPKKLLRLVKMCSTETYSRVPVGKICLTGFLLGMV
jgi:hypothetical protein